jgi:putative Mn2+ efflux pump MntP
MQLITIIVIAVGLAMDAFAVSIVSGSAYRQLKVTHALRMAVFFGSFQAIMPLLGSLAGVTVRTCIADYDHWVAFVLLSAVGSKMIYESFRMKTDQILDPSSVVILLFLSVATSIDALTVGLSLPFLQVSLVEAVVVIGLVTFILSYLGVHIGRKVGHFFENRIEAAGGLILIGLGAKILFEHLRM